MQIQSINNQTFNGKTFITKMPANYKYIGRIVKPELDKQLARKNYNLYISAASLLHDNMLKITVDSMKKGHLVHRFSKQEKILLTPDSLIEFAQRVMNDYEKVYG